MHIGGLGDDYVLGIFCVKTGLVDYAKTQLKIERDKTRRQLFNTGLWDARRCKLSDVAYELQSVRQKTPQLFDRLVREAVGLKRHAEILRVISEWRPEDESKRKREFEEIWAQFVPK